MTTTEPATAQPLSYAPLVGQLREAYDARVTRPLAWRKAQLDQLVRLLTEGEDELLAALQADLGKPALEGYTADLAFTRLEVQNLRKHLDAWAAPKKTRVGLMAAPGKAWTVAEPLGVALVIAPWNYPVQLLLSPMACAIAAGNAVIGKPSELAPATSAALARLVPKYLDERAISLVEGGVPETTALLAERYDHIFYTGNGRVGRVVARAAAEHLTPTTLELGGKSPVLVDADADLDVTAKRIVWGKFLNAGQTCIAPDHVYVHEQVADALVEKMTAAVEAFYGKDPKSSPDYARIVSDAHFRRLSGMLDAADHVVACGGDRDPATRYLAPTIVTGVDAGAKVMGEEIFGPILPVLPVSGMEEAIAQVNAGDKPLALYVFSGSKATQENVVERTSSGGVCVNHVVLHIGVPELPFGGVGESGMGAYHGKAGFDAFSHTKSVLSKPTRLDPPILYPPFTRWKQWLVRKAL